MKIDYILSRFQNRIHNYITDISQFFQNCLNQIIYSYLRVQNNLKIKLVMPHFNLKLVNGVLNSSVGVWGILKGGAAQNFRHPGRPLASTITHT